MLELFRKLYELVKPVDLGIDEFHQVIDGEALNVKTYG